MKVRLLLFALIGQLSFAQDNPKIMSFEEYMGFVRKFHPLVKSADLEISAAQAALMTARGAFDPVLEADFERKDFKGSTYYNVFNGTFKIPTWYGIEIKAGIDDNNGQYLNPQNLVPATGLGNVGISIPIAQDLFINKRMADLRKAKLQQTLSRADRNLMATAVLSEAAEAYFSWQRQYREYELYQEFAKNAKIRLDGIKILIQEGDKPVIDSTEARIVVVNRNLSLEDSKLKLIKARLELSNFLWIENNVPLELAEDMIPEPDTEQRISEVLQTNEMITNNVDLNQHPKVQALETKVKMLEIERRLAANRLLPRADFGYSYLFQPDSFDASKRFDDYKVGFNFYFPIFIRKERGNLQRAKLALTDANLSLKFETRQLENKIQAAQTEIISLEKQASLMRELVRDTGTMLNAEIRLFEAGESSLFLLNTRENTLISSRLSEIAVRNRLLSAHAKLFETLANPD
ncbi:TolC family protein [Flavobacterium aurantiibacter]|uniref:Transporter n=1 Tax=Flavobacterium aurantiibacter TaxID=2023067 RepID=A0A255ZMU3_9FLAO|nr:TolC family protein [Flavobacterium aurantiibacter]OYQ41993.1 transporter [Flavobacterium aurantiibacter]OYQ42887.1 transporter [Flavobacterium aurantiibacter]